MQFVKDSSIRRAKKDKGAILFQDQFQDEAKLIHQLNTLNSQLSQKNLSTINNSLPKDLFEETDHNNKYKENWLEAQQQTFNHQNFLDDDSNDLLIEMQAPPNPIEAQRNNFGLYQQDSIEAAKNNFERERQYAYKKSQKSPKAPLKYSSSKPPIPNKGKKGQLANKSNRNIKMKTQISASNFNTIEEYFSFILEEMKTNNISNPIDGKDFQIEIEEDEISQNPINRSCLAKNQKNCSKYHSNTNKESLQCTFKPKILKKSQDLSKNKKPVFSAIPQPKIQKMPYQPTTKSQTKLSYQRLSQLSRPRKSKLKSPEQEILQARHLTFKPTLSKKSLEQMSNCTYDVATRNKLWLDQKQEKITKLKKEEQQQKNKRQERSHTPKLTHYKGDQEPHLSKFGKQGMVSYFQRLSKRKNSALNLSKNEINKQNYNVNSKKTAICKTVKNKQTYSDAVKSLHSKILKMKL